MQRRCMAIDLSSCLPDRDHPTPAPFGEFVAEAAFSRSGRAGYPDHLRVSVLGMTESAPKQGELMIAATKRSQVRTPELAARYASLQPEQRINLDRLRNSFQRSAPEGIHVAIWPDQPVAVFAETDGAGLRQALHPVRHMNGQPMHALLSGGIGREHA